MYEINPETGNVVDLTIARAIQQGVVLAQQQGYDVEGLSFIVKNPLKTYEYGASAAIIGDRQIGVVLDKENPNYDTLTQLVVHEINHTEREKHSRIETLEETLVSEGLAQKAEQVAGFASLPVSLFQSDEDRNIAINSVKCRFNSLVLGDNRDPVKNYGYYFQGEGELKKYTGYALGLEIVTTYMDTTGATIQEATQAPASEIVSYWKNDI